MLSDRSVRARVGLLLLSGVLAVILGFFLLTPAQIEPVIIHGGYYFILALFAGFVIAAFRVWRARLPLAPASAAAARGLAIAVALGTLLAAGSDRFEHKVLFDEYVLQGTAWHMHATKEIGTPIRAYDFAGTWTAIDTFLDKRPYFFAFLVSLLHDLTGFRLENVYVLNVGMTLLTLALVGGMVLALTRQLAPAVLAVALFSSLPVFGQNASGASMEQHNLAMIAVTMTAALLYLRRPEPDRVTLLVLSAALLAQSRYESVLFVIPTALVIAVGWWRARRVVLPWPAILAPLLLVPYAWHDRFVSAKPALWQLREGETSRFGWEYLANNLEGARKFLFSVSSGQPSSLVLTLLGLGGLAWLLLRLVRTPWSLSRLRELPAGAFVVAGFGVTIAANLGLLMFYYWSRLDEPITSRFSLPFYLLLAVVAGLWVARLRTVGLPAARIAFGAWGLWLAAIAAPAYAKKLYTEHNLVMHELNWELEQVVSRPGPKLVITSKATMPYLLQRIPALTTSVARARGPQIAWHVEQGTFDEVLVAQVLRPTTPAGQIGIDPDDLLPPEFRLEEIDRKRFGARWIRVSRLVGVDPAAPAAAAEATSAATER